MCVCVCVCVCVRACIRVCKLKNAIIYFEYIQNISSIDYIYI